MPVNKSFHLILLSPRPSHSHEARLSSFSQRKLTALRQRRNHSAVNGCGMVVTSPQDGRSPPCPGLHVFVSASLTLYRIVCVISRIQRSGDVPLSKLGYKRLWLQSWAHFLSLSSLALGEASCHVVSCLMRCPHGKGLSPQFGSL